jgi:FKBP-type peptidyl-prolyl cis-trans isomerase FkpA
VSIRLPALALALAAALALACSQEEKAPAADAAGASPSADAPITASATAPPAVKTGAPDGSPFSVTHHVEGDGASPTASDEVRVNYEGRLADGTVFDSSYARNEAITFPLGGVIPCWTQGVAQMKVGGKATLVCPPEMAYGSSGTGPIPPNATLTFDVELLGIETAPASPQ